MVPVALSEGRTLLPSIKTLVCPGHPQRLSNFDTCSICPVQDTFWRQEVYNQFHCQRQWAHFLYSDGIQFLVINVSLGLTSGNPLVITY